MPFLETFPQLSACCLCLSDLRLGSILVALYFIVELILQMIVRIVFLIYDNSKDHTTIFWLIFIQLFVCNLPQLLAAILLLFGAVKRSIRVVAIYSWIQLFLWLIELILLCISLMILPIEMVYLIPITGFHFYLWLCVNSYFLELLTESENTYRKKYGPADRVLR